MSTSAFPDISASGASSPPGGVSSSSKPWARRGGVPSWARAIFSRFPLYELPSAEIYDEGFEAPPSRPRLYVAPGHPLPSSSRKRAAGLTWTSSDPRCLRWQVELLLRGQAFECRAIDELESWGPDSARSLPFLHLSPEYQVASHVQQRLISAKDLPRWAEHHAPWTRDRIELGPTPSEKGKEKAGIEEDATDAEARVWTSLLETKVMAAVVRI